LFTLKEKFGKIQGLKVAIVGDILHSRVAMSNIYGLIKLGAQVMVVGPPTLIPKGLTELGVEVEYNLDRALSEVDVVNMLRIQLERQQKGLFPSLREYARLYGLNKERLNKTRRDLVVMHPGPTNLGVEITEEAATDDRSVITTQVTNGVAVRMAIFYLLNGGRVNDGFLS
jgi:aspartate carbamoyltransferase catalytic subunit